MFGVWTKNRNFAQQLLSIMLYYKCGSNSCELGAFPYRQYGGNYIKSINKQTPPL